jgi:hypothetical protein
VSTHRLGRWSLSCTFWPLFFGGAKVANGDPTSEQVVSTARVRMVPDISAAAFRNDKERQVVLWYALRSLPHAATGVLYEDQALRQLDDVFGYTESTFFHHLALGEGKFWQRRCRKGRVEIALRGAANVAAYFHLSQLTCRHFHEVTAEQFNTPRKRTGQLYASCLTPGEIPSSPISRLNITAFTGIPKTRQLRLEKVAGIRKVYQPGLDSEGRPLKVEVYGKNKTYVVNKRLPNVYHTGQIAGNRGILKKIAKSMEGPAKADGAHPLVKRYFSTQRRLINALMHRGPGRHEGYYRVPLRQRLIPGRQEWAYMVLEV